MADILFSSKNIFQKIVATFVVFFFVALPFHPLFALAPNDADIGSQWYLKQVNAERAWDFTTGSSNVIVAILDSGMDMDHPDLEENLWTNPNEIPNDQIDNDGNGYVDDVHGWDFLTNDNFPNPKFDSLDALQSQPIGAQHGTLVAGIIGARGNNGQGIAGVNWRVSIMPLRVVNSRGSATLFHILEGLDYAIAQKADVISLSFVGNATDARFQERIRKAYEQNIVIVAAAGNDDAINKGVDLDVTPQYPVCLDGVTGQNMIIGVAATDTLDQKAHFSHYGKNCIDIAAPGVNAYATTVYSPKFGFNTYYSGPWSGTSFAVPLVAGTAALLKSIDKRLTPKDILELLQRNAEVIDDQNLSFVGKLGAGRLNIGRTIAEAAARFTTAFSPQASSLPFERISFLATGPLSGAPPEVHIVNGEGAVLQAWMAFDRKFRGGVRLGAGDVNGDGQMEVVVLAGLGGGPQVRVFDTNGKLLSQFFAFEKTFRGDRDIVVTDVDENGKDDILVRRRHGGKDDIRVFTRKGTLIRKGNTNDRRFFDGEKEKMRPFLTKKTAQVLFGNLLGDRDEEVILVPQKGGDPVLQLLNVATGERISTIRIFPKTWKGGVSVTVIP